MLVDYLLIGYGRDGEIKSVEHESDSMLFSELTFTPGNEDITQYHERVFVVKVIHHLGTRYAVAIARDVSAAEINELIETSNMNPIPQEVIGEI